MAHSSRLRYLLVWLALVALTGLSFLLSTLHLGQVDVVVALSIAAVKSALVVVFFMHILEEGLSIRVIPVAAVFFILLLVALVTLDVATRRTVPPAPVPHASSLAATWE
jgi:cytochrome c oxidase subunit 4